MVTDRPAKQVIVMRTDLNMRKGKMVAQGAHASTFVTLHVKDVVGSGLREHAWTPAWDAWITGSFTKVCVGVDSEEGLLAVLTEAQAAGLPIYLVTDAGRTEFHGQPTRTCLAIGPAWADEVDAITGKLRLL